MATRRDWLKQMMWAGVGIGATRCAWTQALANRIQPDSQQQLIVLWMAGGPSQIDTFDMKVGHANGGEFKDIETSVPGIRFSEHLPNLSKQAHKLAIVRSLQTKEGDHGRGTFLVRTGQRPGAPFKYPSVPATLAKELSPGDPMIPNYVSILPPTFINPAAYGSGFLGPNHQPLTVGSVNNFVPGVVPGSTELKVENLRPSSHITSERIKRRREMWDMLQETYGASEREGAPKTHDAVFRKAMQLSDSDLNSAFDLDKEPAESRGAYGPGRFAQGCLMARRLIEKGVPVVEVAMTGGGLGWDTHADNFRSVKTLCEELDVAWAQLIIDLEQRGLLESTTILWIGEFGRTPQINAQTGRDHFPDAWSCVLAGGRIAGGQVYGETTDDGMQVKDKPVTIQQVLATVADSVGVNPAKENISELGRPIKVVEGEPIVDLLI